MRKILSVFLTAVVLVMSVFCVNAFAQEQTRMEKWTQNVDDYEFEAKITNKINDEKNVAKMYVKGKKIALISNLPLTDNMNTKIKFIIKDGYVYILFPDFPFFHFKIEGNEDMFQIPEIGELIYVKSYEKQNGSVTYYVEEFEDENNNICKYYFFGDALVKIEAESIDEYNNHMSSIMEIVSYEVNDSVFRVPFFSINIAPFLNIIY